MLSCQKRSASVAAYVRHHARSNVFVTTSTARAGARALAMPADKSGVPAPASTRSLFQALAVAHRLAHYRRSAVIFAQGGECAEVMYLQQGSVKLSVLSPGGKEAIVSVPQPGDFFGEGCLAGQQVYIATAVAMNASTVAVIDKKHMFEMLHTQPELNEQFLTHTLRRNIRIEEDLIDHLFNSVEKRLARTLLLLARYGTDDGSPQRIVPRLSQEALAEIVGTTRGRVNFFMNKFRKLGFIDYNGGIKVKPALLSVVLHA
jgi:CRP/FNR family transcriptional regulator, cyclic AMP receptor protein